MQTNKYHQKNNSRTVSKCALIAACFGLFACKPQSASDENRNVVYLSEAELCSTSTAYGTYATVTGTATFSKRSLTVAKTGSSPNAVLTSLTLGAPISSPLPIRFAEIRVLNSAGAVVQCGKTNTVGALKALDGVADLRIPATADTYTVQVFSRANHTFDVGGGKPTFVALFSVKEDIYSNELYKVTSTVSVTGASSYPTTLTATALESVSSKIEGGAFNIYNNVISSYDYLSTSTTTQNLSCLSPKMSTYWKAGFNPNQYIYPSTDPASLGTVSFYLRSDNEMYINGGVLGDVSSVDTDHFDDAVIIHELGHHVENSCGVMESPGGSHSGSAKIDPRLAWSEGWGNFFAAHIIKNKIANINPDLTASMPNGEWLHYFDSEGYTDGAVTSGYEYIKFNLARPGNATTENIYQSTGTGSYAFDQVNSTTYPGESHFREVSVSRGLFKAVNGCTASAFTANCKNTSFNLLWQAFGQSTGMGSSIYPFRSSARFLDRYKAVQSGGVFPAPLTSLFTVDEALQNHGDSDFQTGGSPDYTTWFPYGIKLVPSVSACYLQMEPRENNTSYKSDQRYSNHFYYIDKGSLPGVTSLRISTVAYVSGTTGIDLDMLVFDEAYKYNEDCNSSSCSKSTTGSLLSARGTSYPKTLSIAGLSASEKYLLNIRAYTPSTVLTNTKYNYVLTDQSGGYLCPNPTY